MTVKIKLDTKRLDKIIRATAGESVKRRTIADRVEYGIFQEFTASGHPSLRPAFEKVTRDLPKATGLAIEAGVSLDDLFAKAAFDIQALWAADVNIETGAFKNSIHVKEG